MGSAGLYMLASVLARTGALILIPLYTRKLTIEEYGDYALAQTLVAMLPSFLSLGLSAAVSRFYFDGNDPGVSLPRVGGVARWLLLLTVLTSALLQAGIAFLGPAGGTGITGAWELTCVVWAAAGSAIAVVPLLYLKAAQRATSAVVFQLGQFVLNVAAGMVCVGLLARGLRGAIEALALAGVLNGLAATLFILVTLPGSMTRSLLREALRFSLPFVPHYAANQLQYVSDRWTMKATGLQAALGSYSLAGQLTAPIVMVVGAWNEAFSPRMGEMYRLGALPNIRRNFRSVQRSYVLSAALPSAGLLLLLPAAAWMLPRDYAGALWLVPLLLVSSIVEALYLPNVNVLFYAGRTGQIPKITISAGVLNTALNLVLIPLYGVLGAVAARFVSMTFRTAVVWYASRECLGAELPSNIVPG
jgi:O-antigen/teichoic acid export membrane protein